MSLKTLIDSSLGSWTGPKSTVSAVALMRRQYYGSGKMNENSTPSNYIRTYHVRGYDESPRDDCTKSGGQVKSCDVPALMDRSGGVAMEVKFVMFNVVSAANLYAI